MKPVRNSLLTCFAVVLFSGCYTELATVEHNDRDYADDSDTTYDQGSTTVNNQYYLDDDYRRSRLRVSFHYYYPENTSWIGAYYNSYFNDPYWGMRPFSWSYDPWYGYYPSSPWCYTPPYYDPWNPYYHHYHPIAYYPVYYPSPAHGSRQPSTPPRIRTEGPSRDGNISDGRSRPIAPPAETQITTVRTARGNEKEVTPVQTPVRKRGNEVSWWDRKDNERTTEARPVDRPRGVRIQSAPTKQSRASEQATSSERPREVRRPTYTPSTKPSSGGEARPVERPRESRRESSYSPPPQQSAPAPARSGGSSSGSSSSSGGRKRD